MWPTENEYIDDDNDDDDTDVCDDDGVSDVDTDVVVADFCCIIWYFPHTLWNSHWFEFFGMGKY